MDEVLRAILGEIVVRLGDWYPAAPARPILTVLGDERRALARLIRIRVGTPSSPIAHLIVKAEAPSGPQRADEEDRPRLVPRTPAPRRRALEFDALRRVEEVLVANGDERLRAVRPLAVLDEPPALVMEEFEGRPLQRLLIRSMIGGRSAAARPLLLANAAGSWLRTFHGMPASPGQQLRQSRPSELVAAFVEFGTYLGPRSGSRDVEGVARIGADAASGLADPLPTVVSHGDFAPRNILVDASGRLAVIDLMARWQAPRYEDLATFLVALDTSRANVATRGLVFGRPIGRLEGAFLAGYFGSDPVPRHAIRVYELLLLLDKWSARIARNATIRGPGRIREALIDRHFERRSRHLARLLRDEV